MPSRNPTLLQKALTGTTNALRGTAASYRSLPPTTAVIIAVCFTLQLLSFLFTSLPQTACLSARNYLSSPLTSIPRLFLNHFVHVGVLHFVLNSLAWPAFAVPAETALGTVQFAYVVMLLSVVDSVIYITLGLVLGVVVEGLVAFKVLDRLLLPTRIIDTLETGRLFARISRWQSFVPAPAAVSLPTNARSLPGSNSSFSLPNPFGRTAAGSARYAPLNNPVGAGSSSDRDNNTDTDNDLNDNDPLMWDEDEILEEEDAEEGAGGGVVKRPADTLVDVDGVDEDGGGGGGGTIAATADLLGVEKA
ncbi:hypothetical protein HDU86_006786 [Geranomyces michiganensis]|nr:hypothetical protein HDU86_006786 [Geranomyces michiganensis]